MILTSPCMGPSHTRMREHLRCTDTTVELNDSENFTTTLAEIVIFTIMNTITIVNLLNISTKIQHVFLKYYKISQL